MIVNSCCDKKMAQSPISIVQFPPKAVCRTLQISPSCESEGYKGWKEQLEEAYVVALIWSHFHPQREKKQHRELQNGASVASIP